MDKLLIMSLNKIDMTQVLLLNCLVGNQSTICFKKKIFLIPNSQFSFRTKIPFWAQIWYCIKHIFTLFILKKQTRKHARHNLFNMTRTGQRSVGVLSAVQNGRVFWRLPFPTALTLPLACFNIFMMNLLTTKIIKLAHFEYFYP